MRCLPFIAALWLLSCTANGQSKPIVETSLGVGIYNIKLQSDPDLSISSVGEYAGLSFGYSLGHTLNVMSTVRIWSAEDEQEVDHALLHDFHFAGLSLGIDAQMYLPSLSNGPYGKVGRHCWVASVYEAFNIWDGSGCSNILAGGISWKSDNELAGDNFFELMLTRFKYVRSWMFIVGHRF